MTAMSEACYCGTEPTDNLWALYRETYQVARKPYRCGECGGMIQPGRKYHKVTGLWDGDYWVIHRTCMPCSRIRDDFCKRGFIFGELCDIIRDCLELDYTKIPPDEAGVE